MESTSTFNSWIVEFHRKIVDGRKRMKKAMRCNWPEPSLYCGCCTLSTGIYIRSVLIIVVTSVTLGINGWILDILLQIRQGVYNKNLTEIGELWDPETDIESIYFIYKAVIIYYILWITLKIVYILIVFWTIYAVYRKHTKMLKILIYISIPSVIVDFLISVAGSMMLDNIIKIVLLMCILSEGYNILALNSEYKKITGKSRAVVDARELEPNTLQYTNNYHCRDLIFRPGYNRAHCRSCTCYDNIPESPPEYNSTREINSAETSGPIVNNITESSLVASTGVNNLGVFKPNKTRNVEQSSYTYSNIGVDASSNTNYNNSYEARPALCNMSNPSNRSKEVKIELSDHPVIYDERQLDVGTSPVIEDRPVNNY